jgi:hypothetical protein
MRWETGRQGKGTIAYVDVAGVGRYLVKWSSVDERYVALLNNETTTYKARTMEAVQRQVERAVLAIENMDREQEATVALPDYENIERRILASEKSGRLPLEDMEAFADEVCRQARHYAQNRRHIVLTDIYLALETVARKCAQLQNRVKELEDRYERDDHRS